MPIMKKYAYLALLGPYFQLLVPFNYELQYQVFGASSSRLIIDEVSNCNYSDIQHICTIGLLNIN